MSRPRRPLHIVIYEDVLCGWCYVADRRLEGLRHTLGPWASFETCALPLWPSHACAQRERRARRAELLLAKKEPEGRALTDELWWPHRTPPDGLSAALALEAARLQGLEQRLRMARLLRTAALEYGADVSRRDVLFELVARAGLEPDPFWTAFDSPGLRALLSRKSLRAHRLGVRAVPALVIEDRWLITGLREHSEYLELLARLEPQARHERRRALQ